MKINDYQRLALKTDFAQDADVLFYGLIGEFGGIFSAHKKRMLGGRSGLRLGRAEMKEELGDALWYLSAIASEYNLKLAEIAELNIKKTENYFLSHGPRYLDAAFPRRERLPRKIVAKFHRISGDRAQLTINRRVLGDNLDDNAMKPDGYRFHDVFHIAFATYLTWSPVLRSLLKIKRKSVPLVDHTEDGARARAIEEAISAFLFAEHKKFGGFDNQQNIRFRTLETVKRVTSDLEVRSRTIPDWSLAISQGYRAFEKLKAHKGGVIVADLKRRRMTFRS